MARLRPTVAEDANQMDSKDYSAISCSFGSGTINKMDYFAYLSLCET